MIKKILDNYFNNIYKNNLEREILTRFDLDIDYKEFPVSKMCYLLAKPVEYKNYTMIHCWNKDAALILLINSKEELKKVIDRMSNLKW